MFIPLRWRKSRFGEFAKIELSKLLITVFFYIEGQ